MNKHSGDEQDTQKHGRKPLLSARVDAGYIDGIVYGDLRGWVVQGGSDPVEIILLVDGIKHATTIADEPRPDLKGEKTIGQMSGFSFDLGNLPGNTVSHVSARIMDSGFNFHGELLRYCPAVTQHIELLGSLFFAEYYRSENGLVVRNNEEAFEHYLNFGIYEDLDPNPWFSSAYFRQNQPQLLDELDIPVLSYLLNESNRLVRPSACFDPEFYTNHYSDLSALDRPFTHYVLNGHREGRTPVKRELPDCILSELNDMLEIESGLTDLVNTRPHIECYPHLNVDTFLPGLLRLNYPDQIEALVCVPYITVGGADLYASYVLSAFQQVFGKERVLLVVTDQSSIEVEQWLDDGTQVHFLVNHKESLSLAEKVSRLHCLAGVLAPSRIFNTNSHSTWELYKQFGKQMSSVTRLYANIFCFDSKHGERPRGYLPDYLPETLQWLTRVYTDNTTIIDDIEKMYGFSPANQEKFQVLYAPCPYTFKLTTRKAAVKNTNRKVLWIGRMAVQKRPDKLVEIAAALPFMDFVVYGPEGDSSASHAIASGCIANIEYRGVFDSPEDLDLDEFSLYLNTSDWDGLPNTLIQMAKSALPVVTSNVGGINELINEQTGWLIDTDNKIDDYVLAIRQIAVGNKIGKSRPLAASKLVTTRHRWEAFFEVLESTGAFESNEMNTKNTDLPVERRSFRKVG